MASYYRAIAEPTINHTINAYDITPFYLVCSVFMCMRAPQSLLLLILGRPSKQFAIESTIFNNNNDMMMVANFCCIIIGKGDSQGWKTDFEVRRFTFRTYGRFVVCPGLTFRSCIPLYLNFKFLMRNFLLRFHK